MDTCFWQTSDKPKMLQHFVDMLPTFPTKFLAFVCFHCVVTAQYKGVEEGVDIAANTATLLTSKIHNENFFSTFFLRGQMTVDSTTGSFFLVSIATGIMLQGPRGQHHHFSKISDQNFYEINLNNFFFGGADDVGCFSKTLVLMAGVRIWKNIILITWARGWSWSQGCCYEIFLWGGCMAYDQEALCMVPKTVESKQQQTWLVGTKLWRFWCGGRDKRRLCKCATDHFWLKNWNVMKFKLQFNLTNNWFSSKMNR